MKLSGLQFANLGRAIILALVAQVVAGAMCFMPSDAMASSAVIHRGTAQSHSRRACPHCDAPVQAVSQIDIAQGLLAPAQLPIPAIKPAKVSFIAPRGLSVSIARILAPPGSASFIYSINRRIRI